MTCKCGGSGLVPFVKNGKVIPYAWVDCSCKETPVEHYHKADPSDFDFPCSSTFRAFSYQYCNQPDPGYIPPGPEAPAPQIIEHRHSDMSKQDYNLLQQTIRKANYLEDKLNELTKPKDRAQRKPTGYKGIK